MPDEFNTVLSPKPRVHPPGSFFALTDQPWNRIGLFVELGDFARQTRAQTQLRHIKPPSAGLSKKDSAV